MQILKSFELFLWNYLTFPLGLSGGWFISMCIFISKNENKYIFLLRGEKSYTEEDVT